jgi:hypothetical protein
MPSKRFCLKALALAAVLAPGPVAAQDDPWYGGVGAGSWGVGKSLGLRGSLPGTLSLSGSDSLSTVTQFGGYRVTDAIAIEGAQTSYGLSGPACGGDPLTGDYRACYGSAWSVAGVAAMPISGLSLYGRLGLHYWQTGSGLDEGPGHRNAEDLGRVLGVGMSYELNRAVTFHAESERYSDLSGGNGTGPGSALGLDSSVHSIGLSIKF